MGPAFVILLWAILATVFGTIWLLLAVAFFIAWKKKKIWLRWLSGVPLTFLSLAALLLVGTVGIGVVASMSPKVMYKRAFGSSPPPQVSDLRGKYWSFADSGSIYLRFQCPPETFRLLSADFETIDRAGFEMSLGGFSHPDWWILPSERETVLLRSRRDFRKDFSSEWEGLAYDPRTQTVLYHYHGID